VERIDRDFRLCPKCAVTYSNSGSDKYTSAVFDRDGERILIYKQTFKEHYEETIIEIKGAPVYISLLSDVSLALLSFEEVNNHQVEYRTLFHLVEFNHNNAHHRKNTTQRRLELNSSDTSNISLYCDTNTVDESLYVVNNCFISQIQLLSLKERVRLLSKCGRWEESFRFALSCLEEQENRLKQLLEQSNHMEHQIKQCEIKKESIKQLIAKEIEYIVDLSDNTNSFERKAELCLYYSLKIERADLIFGKIYESFSRYDTKIFFQIMLQFFKGHRSIVERYPDIKELSKKSISIPSDKLKRFITEHTTYAHELDSLFAFSEILYRVSICIVL
jgi:uncharacterized protein YdcH (DUF465 family)